MKLRHRHKIESKVNDKECWSVGQIILVLFCEDKWVGHASSNEGKHQLVSVCAANIVMDKIYYFVRTLLTISTVYSGYLSLIYG